MNEHESSPETHTAEMKKNNENNDVLFDAR